MPGTSGGRAFKTGTPSPSSNELLTIQENANTGLVNATPASSAMPGKISTTRGLLPCRMTATPQNAMDSPSSSLIEFDTCIAAGS